MAKRREPKKKAEDIVVFYTTRDHYSAGLDELADKLTEQFLNDNSIINFDPEGDTSAEPPTVNATQFEQYLTDYFQLDERDSVVSDIKKTVIKRKVHAFYRVCLELDLLGYEKSDQGDEIGVAQVDVPDVVASLNPNMTSFSGAALVGKKGVVTDENDNKYDILYAVAYWHGHYICVPYICDLEKVKKDDTDVVIGNRYVHEGTATRN